MREALIFLDALVLLFRLLPMRCPLTVLVFLSLLLVGAVVGVRLLGVAGWGRAGAAVVMFVRGGSTTSIIVGIGVLDLVCRWWTRGVVRRFLGHVGLLDVDMPLRTLGGAAASTLGGCALSTLGSPVPSTLCSVLLERMVFNSLRIAMCFCL